MAPATKNGGKMVACHRGTIDTAKSKDTTVCTESTSGVLSPPRSRYTCSYRRQCIAAPRREDRDQANVPEHQRHGEVRGDGEHVPGERGPELRPHPGHVRDRVQP